MQHGLPWCVQWATHRTDIPRSAPQASITGSVLRIVKGAGHMVHHLAPRQVADAVEAVAAASQEDAAAQEARRIAAAA
jgi:pimeloyl-ACP methyl ester carboxylesterase